MSARSAAGLGALSFIPLYVQCWTGTTRICASSTSPEMAFADVLITEDLASRWYPSYLCDGFGEEFRVPAAQPKKGARVSFSTTAPNPSISLTCPATAFRYRPHTQWGSLLLAEPGIWTLRRKGDHGSLSMVRSRRTRSIRSAFAWRTRMDQARPTLFIRAHGIDVYLNQSRQWLVQSPRSRRISDAASHRHFGDGFFGTRHRVPGLVVAPALDALRPLRYVDLMRGQKPHLLIPGSTIWARKRPLNMRLRPSSIWRMKRRDILGLRGSPFPSMW